MRDLLPIADRLRWLRRFRDALKSHNAELCALASEEVGKTAFEALTADILPLVASCNWHLRHARGLLGPTRVRGGGLFGLGHSVERRRMPVGRVLIIATWNYPVQLLGIQLVQAIVAGNTVVVKPSERAPRTQERLLALAIEATREIPSMRGAIEARASTREEGARVLREECFDHVVFTGSTAVGRAIAEVCAARLIPSTLELSGSDTAFVLADADAKAAARAIFLGFTANAGQTCMAPRRALVERPALAAFTDELARLVAGARCVRLVDAAAARTTHAAAAAAIAAGGRPITGTLESQVNTVDRQQRDLRAMRPIAILDCPAATDLFRGKHFGPAIAVRAVDSMEEALTLHAEIGQYLATSVWTRENASRNGDLARAISRCGSSLVHVNSVLLPSAHPGISLGGHGASGWGVSRGNSGLLALTREVTVTRTSRFLAPPLQEPDARVLAWLSRLIAWPLKQSVGPTTRSVPVTASNQAHHTEPTTHTAAAPRSVDAHTPSPRESEVHA
jgi:acyl-CoA reductase-like NAD-dependent aldehyde dehydrogenase